MTDMPRALQKRIQRQWELEKFQRDFDQEWAQSHWAQIEKACAIGRDDFA